MPSNRYTYSSDEIGVFLIVKSRTTTTPPGSPGERDLYIVPSGATGAWVGHVGEVAGWDGSAWVYATPTDGFYCWVEDEDIGLGMAGGKYEEIDHPAKFNRNASTAPTATDDTNAGYSISSRWFDTTADKEYVCLDATASAAVWVETTAGAAGGEANTASNVGTGGVGIFKQKLGVNLEFKKVNSGDGISITDDVGNNEVDVALNVNGLTAETTVDGGADYLALYDASAGAHRKVLPSDLPGAVHSETITAWTADTGLYRADITHNLGTEDIIVEGYLTADKKTVGFEDIERTSTNVVRIWVATQENVRIVVSAAQPGGGGGGSTTPVVTFHADHLDNPVTADWKVNALAPLAADSNNSAIPVRLFDDTTEEGVGFFAHVPSGKTNMKIKFKSRAETAPAGARTVGLKLYNRGIPDNAAVEAWSAGNALADIDIPANENWQYDDETLSLATLGVTAGELTQFELTRVNPSAGTELTGDWALVSIQLEFT